MQLVVNIQQPFGKVVQLVSVDKYCLNRQLLFEKRVQLIVCRQSLSGKVVQLVVCRQLLFGKDVQLVVCRQLLSEKPCN